MSLKHNLKDESIEGLLIHNVNHLMKTFEFIDEFDNRLIDTEFYDCLLSLINDYKKDLTDDSKNRMIEQYISDTMSKRLLSDGFTVILNSIN